MCQQFFHHSSKWVLTYQQDKNGQKNWDYFYHRTWLYKLHQPYVQVERIMQRQKMSKGFVFSLFYPCFLTPFPGIWNLFKCCLLESNFILQYSNICSYPTILIDTRLNPNCMQNPKKPNPQLPKDTQRKNPKKNHNYPETQHIFKEFKEGESGSNLFLAINQSNQIKK